MKNICDWNNSKKIGDYKAPIEKDNSKKYRMLCLEHVKEINKKNHKLTVPYNLVSTMRAGVLTMGSLLARYPQKKIKHSKSFAFYLGNEQIYEKQRAQSLYNDLLAFNNENKIEEIKIIDSNPRNNPQPPKNKT